MTDIVIFTFKNLHCKQWTFPICLSKPQLVSSVDFIFTSTLLHIYFLYNQQIVVYEADMKMSDFNAFKLKC